MPHTRFKPHSAGGVLVWRIVRIAEKQAYARKWGHWLSSICLKLSMSWVSVEIFQPIVPTIKDLWRGPLCIVFCVQYWTMTIIGTALRVGGHEQLNTTPLSLWTVSVLNVSLLDSYGWWVASIAVNHVILGGHATRMNWPPWSDLLSREAGRAMLMVGRNLPSYLSLQMRNTEVMFMENTPWLQGLAIFGQFSLRTNTRP